MNAQPRRTVFMGLALLMVAAVLLSGDALQQRVPGEEPDQVEATVVEKPLSERLIGTWILVGEPGNVGEPPAAGGRLKFFTGRHWCITESTAAGKVRFHHGGTYALDGDKLSETIEYANPSTESLLNKAHNFEVRVDGDTYTQIGIDNRFSEVWKRVKSK